MEQIKKMIRERTPLYFAIGERDSCYGSEPVKKAYRKLKKLYQEVGLLQRIRTSWDGCLDIKIEREDMA